jgi:phage tail sheath protein FI
MPKSYIDTLANPTAVTYNVTTLTKKMVEVAAQSKCGCVFLGLPFNCTRSAAVDYKDKLNSAIATVYSKEYTTFAELVGPWCKTTLPISGSNAWITPELAHLLLIINAQGIVGINKWWMIPAGMTSTGVAHSPEYKIKKTYLDTIQNHDEGVCFNPLMEVPGKGFTCFGNSTLWNKPLGTYNALQNLSTRYVMNALEDLAYRCGIGITFAYNNAAAYDKFYAGMTPLLDTMKNVGAINSYYITMAADINGLDQVNANTVIGKVYISVAGVINDIDIDLIALPPQTDIAQFIS